MSDARCLSRLPRPFIVCVITDRTPAGAIATMRLGELDGAHAFEVNLPALAEGDHSALFSAVSGVVYTTCRRRSFMAVYGLEEQTMPDWSDEERMARQLAAIRMGSRAIDIELDTFDPRPAPPLGSAEAARFAATAGEPAELTDAPAAVAKQRAVAAEAKALGAEVLFSCHTGRPQTIDALLGIARAAVERGADLVKIVTPCRDRSDLFTVLEATARLKASLPVPFTLIGAGAAGQLSRVIGANFGSAWVIGQQTFTPGGFHSQPLVSQLRATLRLIPWQASLEAPCA